MTYKSQPSLKISQHHQKISQPPSKFLNPSEYLSTFPPEFSLSLLKVSQPPHSKKSQALQKKSQPLPKKSHPFPKRCQPLRKNLTPLKFLNHPPPPHRKFLNPIPKFSQPPPPKKNHFQPPPKKFLNPPPPQKISQSPLKISQPSKNMLTGNPPLPPPPHHIHFAFYFFLPLFLHFSKKI